MTSAPPTAAVREHPSRVPAPAAEAGRVLSGPRALPWVMIALAAAAGILAPGWTAVAAPWPFVVALVVFGMPHGAADWVVAARVSGRAGTASRLAGFVGYLGLMVASIAAIMWQPGASALLFLLLTVFHFGMADATAVHADDDGLVARWGLALGRGLLLLSTAFAAHPAEAWEPFARIGDALSPWAASAWQPGLAELQRLALVGAATGGVLAACSAVARIRAGHARGAACDLLEHGLVAAMAATADPLFAVGCYFLAVHAFRHLRRLACTQGVIGPATAGPPRAGLSSRLLRVHVLSLPLMWPTALCLAALCWLIGGSGARTLADASIAFYMVTTLSHHLLGLRLPRPDMAPAAAVG
ncbi:MAG: Brp/Blh family beta-carotene 15,15'-dioxygenase [Phycisphaerales bacterium]